MGKIIETTSCEVCGNTALDSVLNLGLHPLRDDLVQIGDKRICREYPIEILFCRKCITAHQRFQVPKHELFPPSYHYRSRFTGDVLNGMSQLVEACENRLSTLAKKTVLDIGCNDGSLLNFFRNKGSLTIGVEPTSAYLDAKANRHEVYNDFLSENLVENILKNHGHPDVITFTNVFAHIENLPELIRLIKSLCSPTTMIVIENHYLGAIIEKNQFDTFYHEHPRSYSYSSFIYIANLIGKKLSHVEFPSRYGGNIRVFLSGQTASQETTAPDKILESENLFLRKFERMRADIEKWKSSKTNFIQKIIKQGNGKIIGKAFPGRAAILIKLLGITEDVLSAVYEKPGSMKIGHYVPGTRIPILSDDDLFLHNEKPSEILNLAWHISNEIKSYLVEKGFTGVVIDILNKENWRVPA